MLAYPLPDDPEEHARLDLQAEYFRPATDQFLAALPLRPGMRVLDVGCGTGRVAAAVTRLLPAGEVVGIDISPAAVEAAVRAVPATAAVRVRFVEATPETLQDAPFDVAVGRLVLMYEDDPAAALRRVRGLVRPGGCVAFLEADHDPYFATDPPSAVFDRYRRYTDEVAARYRVHQSLGLRLAGVFAEAGLRDVREVPLDTPDDPGIVRLLAATHCSMKREMIRRGWDAGPAPTPDEVTRELASEAGGGRRVFGSRLVCVVGTV